MNQSELIAAYEFLLSAINRVVDIQVLDKSLNSPAASVCGEMVGLMKALLPLIGQTVVQDRPDGGSRR